MKLTSFSSAILLLAISSLVVSQYGQGSPRNRALRPLNKEKVVYALNCGSSSPLQSEHGFVYEGDKYFGDGTTVANYPDNHPNLPREGIKYTGDTRLHQNERYSLRPFLDYNLPVKQDGSYVLILQFCELNFMSTGQRVAHVYLGDSVIRPNFDTLKGGRQSQVSLYVPFKLENGQVYYAGNRLCEQAFDRSSSTLKLRFKKVIDNPKVDGIILFKGTLEETNFFTLDAMKRDFDSMYTSNRRQEQLRDQMMEGYMRKQRMKKVFRNDDQTDEEFESEFIVITPGAKNRTSLVVFAVMLVIVFGAFWKANSANSSTVRADDYSESKKSSKGKKQAQADSEEESPENEDKKTSNKGGKKKKNK